MGVEFRRVPVSRLETNAGQLEGVPGNPRQWTRAELDRLKASIKETPELFEARGCVAVPRGGAFVVLGGNMRLAAAKELGERDVPCMVLPEGLPASKLREIVIKDNGAFGAWDMDALANEWDDLPLKDWGAVNWDGAAADWTKTGLSSAGREAGEGYEEFVDKFKPKLTTDDCYTPPEVYAAVLAFVREQVHPVDDKDVIRPFKPGGDYEREDYPPGGVVVDNPPFSILSKIVKFYMSRGVPFFLFAPALTLFNAQPLTFIVADAEVTYENGAVVRTGFVTNMCGDLRVWLAPALGRAIAEAQKTDGAELRKYNYPPELVTSATLGKLAARGLEWKVRADECRFVRNVEWLKARDKGLFGGGFLLGAGAAEARRRLEEEARRRLEEEARRRLEEEARRRLEEEARRPCIELSENEKKLISELS